MDPAFSWSRANHVRLPWQASRSREDLAVKELITHWLRKREDEFFYGNEENEHHFSMLHKFKKTRALA